MINILLLLMTITLIELLRQRILDFKYSMLIFLVMLSIFIINKQAGSSYLCYVMLGGAGIITYSFCIITEYKKKLTRLIQEKAILKYGFEKRL